MSDRPTSPITDCTDQDRPAVPLHRVVNDALAAIGYDYATQTMAVVLQGDEHVYHYEATPCSTFTEFSEADGMSGFFLRHFLFRPCKKYRPEPLPADV